MPDINKILAKPPWEVSSPHGAPMGRFNQDQGEPEVLHLQMVRPVDGDYDAGGAYWGFGRGTQPLWAAFSPEDTKNDPPVMVFVRASNRAEAQIKVDAALKEEGFTFKR